MKRIAFALLALIPAIALATAAATSPYGIFGGAGTFAQLPGNVAITFATAPTTTSGTLTTAWTGITGTTYTVIFSTGEARATVHLTNASKTVSWTTSLLTTVGTGAVVDGYTTPAPAGTYAYTSDLGPFQSNGTVWFSAGNFLGSTFTIASGCTTSSALVGGTTAGQFATTATTCTPVLNLPFAVDGWNCFAQDITSGHSVVFTQTASTVYSATVTGTTTSGDVVSFNCTPY